MKLFDFARPVHRERQRIAEYMREVARRQRARYREIPGPAVSDAWTEGYQAALIGMSGIVKSGFADPRRLREFPGWTGL